MNGGIRILCSVGHSTLTPTHPGQHSKTAKLLVGMVIPGSVIFLLVIRALNAGHTTTSVMFFFGYLICAVLQVSVCVSVSEYVCECE